MNLTKILALAIIGILAATSTKDKKPKKKS